MPDHLRCARCGRRVGIYVNKLGRYVAHRVPLALHAAVLARPPWLNHHATEPAKANGGQVPDFARMPDSEERARVRAALSTHSTDPRPPECCGKCPPLARGGYDCTCKGNPRCTTQLTQPESA